MTIRGFLLGTAALAAVLAGPRAALAQDAEEYVRVCDVYGAGFFYIPGTETCLKLSGYHRVDIHYWPGSDADAVAGTPATDEGYYKYIRFAPSFTAQSETEWGTLTGHATVFLNWTGTPPLDDYQHSAELDHMYLEIAGFRLGKGDTPYSRFLGYGPTINWYDGGWYGFNNASELSYTWTGGNGLSAIFALIEDVEDTDITPDFEAGIRIEKDWGSVGVIGGFDEFDESWGAKFVARFAVPNTPVSVNFHAFYSSETTGGGNYTILDADGTTTEFSALLGVDVALGERVGINTAFQWFDTGGYYIAANMPINVAGNLYITPEIAYNHGPINGGFFNGLLRTQLDF
jgi:hypothetical protein